MTSTSPATLEYYQGSLSHIAPEPPGTVVELDSGASVNDGVHSGPAPILGGSWDTSEKVVTGEHVARVIYERGGALYRVGTDPDVTPTPVRVSSESAADTVCRFRVGQDFDNPENARIVYAVDSSSSPDCSASSRELRVTRLGADSGAAPGLFPGDPIVGLIDPDDGSHAGWLTLDGGDVKLRQPDGNVTTVAGNPGGLTGASYLESLRDGRMLLSLDEELWIYGTISGLEPLGHTFGGLFSPQYATDGDELYFSDDAVLYRTDLAGGGPVVTLDAPSDVGNTSGLGGAQRLTVTRNHVVWIYPRDQDSHRLADTLAIRSVDKSTGAGTDLGEIEVSPVTRLNQGLFRRSGEWFLYTRADASGVPEAVAVKVDGSAQKIYSGARWVGATINLGAIQEMGSSVEILYLVEGLSSVGADYGGAALKAVDADAPDTSVSPSTIPAGVKSLSVRGGYGSSRLGLAQADDGSGGTTWDVYFLDAPDPGSLQGIATDTTRDEFPVTFF